MKVYPLPLTQSKTGRRRMAKVLAWLRDCDEVRVYAGEAIGYVRTTKATVADLLKRKGEKLTAQNTPELGLLFIDPVTH